MINWRNTKLPKLEGEDEITSVFEMLTNKTYELGFQYCSFKMSSQIPKNKAKPIDINNYPSEWSTLYDQAHFFDIDPVVQHCKTSVLPVVWEEDLSGLAQPVVPGADTGCERGMDASRA